MIAISDIEPLAEPLARANTLWFVSSAQEKRITQVTDREREARISREWESSPVLLATKVLTLPCPRLQQCQREKDILSLPDGVSETDRKFVGRRLTERWNRDKQHDDSLPTYGRRGDTTGSNPKGSTT
ncbi:hypothetical protein BDY19DRAFT_1051985 [Irpex rosettiformis]|uniref:Uncharacterized protein n=1 Tax=Irpex rosettiformis TaxID=378272 RepID=A0ACB8TLZ9_9APHY|nr:hypothetical protein BDY19DRAFT_1051985 [Irpex rosettiformis]